MFKRLTCLILTAVLLIGVLPAAVFATDPTEYKIYNNHLIYTINTETGGFSITTDEGHPDKKYDNDMPLLYVDERDGAPETSYVTVRIDGKDYIFGRDYGLFGLASSTSVPVVSNDGRLIETTWTIKGYSITQRVALSTDQDQLLLGNVGIQYEIKNNSGKAGNVGLRVLFDTALGKDLDAPYVVAGTNNYANCMEQEYSVAAGDMPQQLRAVDALINSTRASYLFFRGWNDGAVAPDRVIVGHWANLANTRYDYTIDEFCDFTNYSNEYRIPDTAYAIYWSEAPLANGATRSAEMLYGVGTFSADTAKQRAGIDISCGNLELNSTHTGYLNNGEINVDVNLDNALDDSVDLVSATVTVSVEQVADENGDLVDDMMHVVGNASRAFQLKKGEIASENFTVKIDPHAAMTAKRIYVTLVGETEDGEQVSETAARYVYIPGIDGSYPKVQFNSVSPEIVYFEGQKVITVNGDVEAFRALKGSDEWDLWLEQDIKDANKQRVRIAKKDVTFLEDKSGKLYGFTFMTDEDLAVGKYCIKFELRGSLQTQYNTPGFTVEKRLEVSSDEKYKTRVYGVAAMIRYDLDQYKFLTFDSEPEYQRFLAGSLVKDGITYNMDDMSQTEVLVTVRGRILEAEREINGVTEKYLQVEAKDSPVTLNGMLSYESDSPLLLEPARNLSGTANNGVQVSGDGTLKVINSITVWKYSWKIAATTGQVFTLGGADDNVTGKKELQVALGGAGFLIQSVGGFLVDLKYGVLTAKKEGDIMVHAVGFGGSISIPIKDPTKKKPTSDPNDEEDYGDIMQNMFDENSEENQKARLSKDTHFSDGNLTAAINDVLFGERLNDAKTDIEDTGFIGISVELELGLPEDILGDLIKNVGGIYAHVIINTIENEYSLTAGLKIKLIECEGTLAFKETEVAGKDVIVPDRIAFYIRDGLKIPLAPPLFMTGLGGGISNLADTIGGEFDTLPPITLDLFTRLSAFETMIGDFTLQASLYGISLEGDMKFKHSEAVFKITAGINARWIDPWHLYMYGKASVIKGLLQGTLSIVISENAFGGYAALAVVIPEEIPFVGGKEVAGVEFAINNKFVGGNIKIIGIKFGVIYYWSGDFDFGEGIDLTLMESAYPDAMDIQSGETEDGGKYVAVYGSNIHKLATSKGLRLMDGGSNSVTVVNPAAQDSLLFEAEFLGAAPDISDLTFTAGGQNIPLVEDDGNGGGNCVIQTRPEGTYIYISITNTSGMAANTVFTLTTATGGIGDIAANGVDSLPVLNNVAVTHASETSRTLGVSWDVSNNMNVANYVDIYVTEDPQAAETAKADPNGASQAFGTRIAHIESNTIADGNVNVDLPESFASGTYYTVVMIGSDVGGMTVLETATPFTFTNNGLPKAVQSARLLPAGNGQFYLSVTDPANPDYTSYIFEIEEENGSQVENALGQAKTGTDLLIGSTMQLQPGKRYRAKVSTLRETDDGKYFYGDQPVYTDWVTLPEIAKPALAGVTSNVANGYLNTDELIATYTFDRNVLFTVTVNGESAMVNKKDANGDYIPASEFRIDRILADGDYLIDFTAMASDTFDTITGTEIFAANPEAVLSFTVDTGLPVLAIDQVRLDSAANTSELFGGNVVFTEANRAYTISGITENNATVTADDPNATVTVDQGRFTVTGTLDAGLLIKEILLTATDPAGNTTRTVVNVLDSNASIDGIEAEIDGQVYSSGDVVELTRTETKNVKIFAKISSSSGSQRTELDPSEVQWEILGERGVVRLTQNEQTVLTAVLPGETSVAFSYGGATANTTSSMALRAGNEDSFKVHVMSEEIPDAPTGLSATVASTAEASDGALIGTTMAMEYSTTVDFATATVCGAGSTEGLPAGTYYVRLRATATDPAGAFAEVQILVKRSAPGVTTEPATSGASDGALVGTTTGMEYATQADFSDAVDCADTRTTGLAAGTYYVRFKETANEPVSYTQTVEIQEKPVPPTGLTATKVSSDSAANGSIVGTTTAMEYATQADFSDAQTCGDGSTTGLAAGTYYVRLKETATEPAGDPATVIVLVKDAPAPAPTGIIAEPASNGGSDGAITGTSSAMEYSTAADFASATTCGEGSTTGLAPGTYYVRVKETADTQAGAAATITIAEKAAAPTGLTAQPATDNNATNGTISGTTAAMEYATQADFSDAISCGAGSTTGLAPGTYYVRTKATNEDPASEFAVVIVPIKDAPAPAPTGVSADPSSNGGTDGSIVGTSSAMEYATQPDFSDAQDCGEGSTDGLAPGTYYVRVKETADTQAGEPATVVIQERQPAPATLTTTKATDTSTGNGSIVGTTAAMEYATQVDFSDAQSCGEGSTDGLAPGTYYVRVKADGTTPASDYQVVTIVVKDGPNPAPTGISATGAAHGASDGVINGTSSAMEYSTSPNFSNAVTCGEGTTEGLPAGTYYVRLKETADNQAGEAATVVIPEGPGAPTQVGVQATSNAGASDGALTGTTTAMEYATQADFSDAVDCEDGKTGGLPAGTYYVRVKATNEFAASDFVTLTVPTGVPYIYSENVSHVTALAGGHATVTLSHTNVQTGTSVTVTIVPEDGYILKEVKVNGETVPLHGRFTLAEVNEDTVIEAVTEPMQTEAQWQNPYKDVKKGDWFYDAVSYVTRSKWMNGVKTDTFAPGNNVTRAMFVTVLYRMDLLPQAGKPPFRDVKPTDWCADAVAWGSESGVVKGTVSGDFLPNSDITREQMAAFLFRYATYKGLDTSAYVNTDLSGFVDTANVSAYAVEAMKWAVGSGLIKGRNGGKLAPTDNASRAEMAVVLCRLEDLLK